MGLIRHEEPFKMRARVVEPFLQFSWSTSDTVAGRIGGPALHHVVYTIMYGFSPTSKIIRFLSAVAPFAIFMSVTGLVPMAGWATLPTTCIHLPLYTLLYHPPILLRLVQDVDVWNFILLSGVTFFGLYPLMDGITPRLLGLTCLFYGMITLPLHDARYRRKRASSAARKLLILASVAMFAGILLVYYIGGAGVFVVPPHTDTSFNVGFGPSFDRPSLGIGALQAQMFLCVRYVQSVMLDKKGNALQMISQKLCTIADDEMPSPMASSSRLPHDDAQDKQ